MDTLNALLALIGRTLGEWRAPAQEIVFNSRDAALLVVAGFSVLAAMTLAWRWLRGRLPGRTAIALPAILPRMRQSPLTFIRHVPFALFLAGLPFFCLALAEPYTPLSARQVSYPGRRIEVIIDASLSMLSPFTGQQLKTQSDTAFSTNMAAAEYFIRTRMKGRYRDLIALEEFGNESYVVTPFTTDYENLLLSLKMISDVNEWQRFPDQGTIIMKAIDTGVDLFKAFDFLKSSGNIMVIFSDGQDNNVQIGQMTLERVLSKAVQNRVPVYMIRTAYARGLYDVIPPRAAWRAIGRPGCPRSDPFDAGAVSSVDLATGATLPRDSEACVSPSHSMPSDRMIVFDRVGKQYRSWNGREVRALVDLTLEIRPGEVFGLAGPNGAGKSTLIALLLGFLGPTTGSIRIDGLEPRRYAERNGVGYLSELVNIPPAWRVTAALRRYALLAGVPAAALDARVETVMEMLGLGEHRAKRVRQLSKGNLQRLGLAQALLSETRVIVLDEPTHGLDPVWTQRFRDVVDQLRRPDRAILIASHNLDELARLADRVGIIDRGRLQRTVDVRATERTVTEGAPYRIVLSRGEALVWEIFPRAREVARAEYEVRALSLEEINAGLAALVQRGALVSALYPVHSVLEQQFRDAVGVPQTNLREIGE